MRDLLESERNSIRLYKELIKHSDALRQLIGKPHPNQFVYDREVGLSIKNLYIDQRRKPDLELLEIPNNETCFSCKDHFITNRPTIDHDMDLNIGAKLESIFQTFLNDQFRKYNILMSCERSDNVQLNMPDFLIRHILTKEVLLYIEFKCIFKPFIKISSRFAEYKCYSHSLTLDCDEKLIKQRDLVKSNNAEDKFVYVYWYDIPCIKGLFWIPGEFAFNLMEEGKSYERFHQAGDYKKDKQTGNTTKIYLPLQFMNNLDSLFEFLYSKYAAAS